MHAENAQAKSLKARVKQAKTASSLGVQLPGQTDSSCPAPAAGFAPGSAAAAGAAAGCAGGEVDAFAGMDTPKSANASPAKRKLCMVCMDAERGERMHAICASL